jgi:hypothetical protein
MFEAVQGPLVLLLMLAFPLVSLIAARLWRAGRLSDRSMAMLVVGLAPTLVFLYGLIQGSSWQLLLALPTLVVLPGMALYRLVLGFIREQSTSLH